MKIKFIKLFCFVDVFVDENLNYVDLNVKNIDYSYVKVNKIFEFII